MIIKCQHCSYVCDDKQPCPICAQPKPDDHQYMDLQVGNLRDDMKQEFREVNKRLVALEATVKQGEPAGPWLDDLDKATDGLREVPRDPRLAGELKMAPMQQATDGRIDNVPDAMMDDLGGPAGDPRTIPDPWPVGAVVRYEGELFEIGECENADEGWQYGLVGMAIWIAQSELELKALPVGYVPPEVKQEIDLLRTQCVEWDNRLSAACDDNDRLLALKAKYEALAERARMFRSGHGNDLEGDLILRDLAAMAAKPVQTIASKLNVRLDKYEALAERADFYMRTEESESATEIVKDLAAMAQK